MKRNLLLCIGLFFCLTLSAQDDAEHMDLSGLWRFQLDPMGFGKTPGSELYLKKLVETIVLPGSTDEGGKGIRNIASHVDRLSRKFEYSGPAWYQREITIPKEWKEKEIILSLERCHWETTVYVDGKHVGTDERLCTPNRFVMTQQLTPGIHTLTLCVDNRLKYPMDQWNHGTTEHTQTNWNGVVGKMEMIAKEKVYIQKMNVYPVVKEKKIIVKCELYNADKQGNSELQLKIREKGGKLINTLTVPVVFAGEKTEMVQELTIGKDIKLWDEFSPNLYELEGSLKTGPLKDVKTVAFGMRDVEQGPHHIRLNDRNIHLRGVLDCAVFPLTGYPSVDVKDWKRIFQTVKSYGMNHIRFHSWCPPTAAFTAADELGLYIQAELPMWIKDVGQYPQRRDFFEQEMYAILEEYGNHPSFILMCNGNENEGDFKVLEDLVKKAQAYDSRRLYSSSTARTHTPSDQYYVSHVTTKGGITVYEGWPSTMWDKRKESDIDVPVIAHEAGQRCMFPDFKEIKKYTGVLEARNFKVFQERLAQHGMLHQAEDFFQASGAHTVLQYKEVHESLLRTPNSGGFQLLGLADFPGQGSAFVGVLDAFWESKGLVTPKKFRESCAPTVLLARFPKRTYMNDENFNTRLDIYHYGKESIRSKKLYWQLMNETGKTLEKGCLSIPVIPCATVDSLGLISVNLKDVDVPQKLTLKVTLADTVRNEWDIWVYPKNPEQRNNGFVYVRKWDEKTKELLEQGNSVLLIPENSKGRKTHFASHFWNPIMFKWDPLIIGTLINRTHPVFKDFPTTAYADWQWWDILNYATAMELNELRNLTPIIQSIDSYETNRKLGIAFEARVGKGRLFVLNVDPEKDINKREATRQLLCSVRNYIASSEDFQPTGVLQEYELDALFDSPVLRQENGQGSAAVKQLLNQ